MNDAYVELLTHALQSCDPIRIAFKGITASPSCIMLRGYPQDDGLRLLRKRLRAAFKESAITSTVDHRYVLTTAHATLMRFVNPSDEIAAFTQFIRQCRDCFDEVQVVDQIELVLNDWCHQQQNTKLIRSFKLGHEAA